MASPSDVSEHTSSQSNFTKNGHRTLIRRSRIQRRGQRSKVKGQRSKRRSPICLRPKNCHRQDQADSVLIRRGRLEHRPLLSVSITTTLTTVHCYLSPLPPPLPPSTAICLHYHHPYHRPLLSVSITTTLTTVHCYLSPLPPPLPPSTAICLHYHHPYHRPLLSVSITTTLTTVHCYLSPLPPPLPTLGSNPAD